jgi:hypothetical protein
VNVAVIFPWPVWCALALIFGAATVGMLTVYRRELGASYEPPEAVHTPAGFYLEPIAPMADFDPASFVTVALPETEDNP